MAAPRGSFSRFCQRTAEFYIPRFPFLSAVNFAMLCSERGEAGKVETLPRELVYLTIAVQFLAATMMSFGGQRSLFALMAAVQTTVTSVLLHTMSPIHLPQWLTIRMIARDAAVVGAFLIIASRVHEKTAKRYRLAYLYPLGCSLIGLFIVGYAVQLYRDKVETVAFMSHVPLGQILQPVFCVCFVTAGLILASDNRNYMRKAAMVLIPMLILVLIFVELDFKYWTGRRRVEYWNHIYQLLKMLMAISSLILMSL